MNTASASPSNGSTSTPVPGLCTGGGSRRRAELGRPVTRGGRAGSGSSPACRLVVSPSTLPAAPARATRQCRTGTMRPRLTWPARLCSKASWHTWCATACCCRVRARRPYLRRHQDGDGHSGPPDGPNGALGRVGRGCKSLQLHPLRTDCVPSMNR
jgi:hypothetical protein